MDKVIKLSLQKVEAGLKIDRVLLDLYDKYLSEMPEGNYQGFLKWLEDNE